MPRNYWYSMRWLEEDASRYDPRQVSVSYLILSHQGSKDVGKRPVHAFYLLLLSQPKIGLRITDKLNYSKLKA